MASPEKVYREFTKRTHRTMAAYLAMVAWTRDLDCIGIKRDEIVRFWGLSQRVEDQRLEWLKEDIEQFFPYVQALWFSKGARKFGSLFIARRKFPEGSFAKEMSDEKRTKTMTEKGIRTEMLPLPTELEMLTKLTGVLHGLVDFTESTLSRPNPLFQ